MKPTITDVSLFLCVEHTDEFCKNGRTDWNAVWAAASCGPRELYDWMQEIREDQLILRL